MVSIFWQNEWSVLPNPTDLLWWAIVSQNRGLLTTNTDYDMIGAERGAIMIYRVIRTENGSSREYDFDDIEDAEEWIRQEREYDLHCTNPKNVVYELFEVES